MRPKLLGLAFCAFVVTTLLGSPIENASITGVVQDLEGAAIDDANVFIHWNERRANGPEKPPLENYSLRTDRSGHFSVAVVPGFYDVCVHASGFSPVCATVAVSQGQVATYAARLKMSALIAAEFAEGPVTDPVPVIPSNLPEKIPEHKN